MSDQRAQIVQLARDQVGAPYRHLGRGPGGFDCLGLGIYVARMARLPVPNDIAMDDYSRNPSGRFMARKLAQYCERVRISEARPGDFVYMAYETEPKHVAVIVGVDPWTVVHADRQAGHVTETTLTLNDRNRIRAAFKFPGVH